MSLFVAGYIVDVECSYLEHGTGTLAVACGDEGCVHVEKSMVVVVFVYSISHVVTYAQYRSKSVGARTKVSYFSQKFEAVTFLLQGVLLGVGSAIDFDFLGLYLGCLAFTHRLYKLANDTEAGAGSDGFECFFVKVGEIDYYLDVLDGATVIEGDEIDMLVAATSAHPTLYAHGCVE